MKPAVQPALLFQALAESNFHTVDILIISTFQRLKIFKYY
ncbi:hypothetical protein QE441_003575 [Chryseobacterium sp. SORGH_AS909]|uniref:Uncharacterized protein n=1 Tax=Chryseobacterium camelliae TaxID=1265445 RepID=A0ABU0TJM4_9FLAO|nr:hypothetical protein [Chryseobacterium camelliae]MDQ1100441.1 hypothetical protein [Chryseobacterium sp. SORGH_AS_1048]MDR6087781.1 hypothetical protein [Chryseobacterium sp. SORGH_AS_0909]MDR6132157.1 hypothetical protein [Chryseobacterium sp. SORGH_AS_1175]MDT3405692.1 hypothetical protein [Pseudacidovorax intermedius]